MKRTFLSNLVLMLILNLLIKPIAIFGIDANVQNQVGTSAYGVYFSLLNLSFLFSIVMDMGINNFTTTQIARYPHVISRYISRLLSFRFILFFLYALITLTVGVAVGYSGLELNLLLLLIFNQLMVTLIAYFRSHFSGLHLFRIDAVFSIMDRLLVILICGSLLYTSSDENPFQLIWFIWSQTTAYTLTCVLAFFVLIRQIGRPRFRFHWVFSLAVFKKSYPYALLVLLMTCYTRVDSVMLERLHPNGAFEAGVYAQGYRLLDAVFMFGMIFAGLLLPIFSRLLQHNRSGIQEVMVSSRNILLGGSLVLACIATYNADIILGWVYTQDVDLASGSFIWLMWSFVGMSFSLIYGTLLTAKGDLRFLNQIAVVGIVLNVALNGLLIPKYGASGSAFATFVTQVFTAGMQAFHCHRHLPITFSYTDIGKFITLSTSVLIPAWFINPSGYLVIAQVVVGLIVFFVLRMISLRDLFTFVQVKTSESKGSDI